MGVNSLCESIAKYVFFQQFVFQLLGSLSKDDDNGNDDARKQWSNWLNEEK